VFENDFDSGEVALLRDLQCVRNVEGEGLGEVEREVKGLTLSEVVKFGTLMYADLR